MSPDQIYQLLRWPSYNVVPIICVLGATWVAGRGQSGWGWFLVVAVLLAIFPKGSMG